MKDNRYIILLIQLYKINVVSICRIVQAVNKYVDKVYNILKKNQPKASKLQCLFIVLISMYYLWITQKNGNVI